MYLIETYPRLASLLARVETGIAEVWKSDPGFLGEASQRALSGRGKRLRPSVLLLAAECAGGANDTSIALASVVELIHAASLIHDDIVDDAPSRHGRRSANSLWGNKVSVLLGDYLLARGLGLLPEGQREHYAPVLATVAAEMCRGQVREIRSAGEPLQLSEYMDIALWKTGKLFAFCGRAGVETAEGPETLASAMESFGERFGVAFQFADDILDLVGTRGRSGKPEGRDVAERKFTLPLILAAQEGGQTASERLLDIFSEKDVTEESVQIVRDIVDDYGAVERAWAEVTRWLEAAKGQLDLVPESDARAALISACGALFPMPVMAGET
ncbi:MAG: polyprenyl synthetase family protein [Armatimonadetes bacterium]|nr:polyprenyl synthetase family protein [Armatimonadota bacterium]